MLVGGIGVGDDGGDSEGKSKSRREGIMKGGGWGRARDSEASSSADDKHARSRAK